MSPFAANTLTCGIDEAGRGPLAGPVYASSVILGGDFQREYGGVFSMLNDSKKLSASVREELCKGIKKGALAWGIGFATHEEIDSINILQATLLAMKRAFEEMLKNAAQKNNPALGANLSVIIDGNKTPDLPVPCKAMVKADTQIPEVMAASILAKTARDAYMNEMALLYPRYGYEKHKGYGTKTHREAVKKYGPSPIQRISFKINPVS